MKEKKWWKAAFSKTYFAAFDDIYSEQRGKKEAEFLIQNLRLKKGTQVLDLACGQGRHSLPLAQHGVCVTGVDASSSLLRVAKKRAQTKKIDVSFKKGDIRTYCEVEKYNIVLVLGNSFGYFNDKDNEQVLSNISASLKTGGWLVLDLSNTLGMLRQKITGEWIQEIPNGKLITRTLNFNPETSQATMQWCVIQNKIKTLFGGMLRFYSPSEIKHLLAERNLIIKKIYGSFSNEPFSIKTKRCLVMARKY